MTDSEKKESVQRGAYVAPSFRFEGESSGKKTALSFFGVTSVTDFSDEAVVLKVKRHKIKIFGADLSLAIYENKIAEIEGRIERIEFS